MMNEPQPGPAAIENAEIMPSPAAPRTRWQKFLRWKFWRWQYTGLLFIVIFTLVFHFIAVGRPSTIVWDEKWYVGDARSILIGNGDVRPEHPPLAKLFIVAGEFIFNGFKVPLKNTGQTLQLAILTDQTNVIYVQDASIFKTGKTLLLDREQLNILTVDTQNNNLVVERDSGGTGIANHLKDTPVYIFTDNPFGWRFFSIVFGTLGIIIFFLVCRKFGLSLLVSLIATFLLALENMTFLHSSLALLDVFMVTFMLAALLTYLNEDYLLCGLFIALSAHCKLVGVLVVIVFFLHFIVYRRKKWLPFLGSLLLSGVVYVLLIMILDFFITGSLENPFTRIQAMLTGTAANTFTDPKLSISSYPWYWIFPQFIQVYYNSPNVPFIIYSYDPQYVSFISFLIQILILPAIGFMVYKTVKGSQSAGLIVLWFIALYLLWIPLTLATNRVTFVFYFLPVTPVICIGIAMAIGDLLGWLKSKRERLGRTTAGAKTWYAAIGFFLLVHLATFIIFNPAIPTIIKTWLPPFNAH